MLFVVTGLNIRNPHTPIVFRELNVFGKFIANLTNTFTTYNRKLWGIYEGYVGDGIQQGFCSIRIVNPLQLSIKPTSNRRTSALLITIDKLMSGSSQEGKLLKKPSAKQL